MGLEQLIAEKAQKERDLRVARLRASLERLQAQQTEWDAVPGSIGAVQAEVAEFAAAEGRVAGSSGGEGASSAGGSAAVAGAVDPPALTGEELRELSDEATSQLARLSAEEQTRLSAAASRVLGSPLNSYPQFLGVMAYYLSPVFQDLPSGEVAQSVDAARGKLPDIGAAMTAVGTVASPEPGGDAPWPVPVLDALPGVWAAHVGGQDVGALLPRIRGHLVVGLTASGGTLTVPELAARIEQLPGWARRPVVLVGSAGSFGLSGAARLRDTLGVDVITADQVVWCAADGRVVTGDLFFVRGGLPTWGERIDGMLGGGARSATAGHWYLLSAVGGTRRLPGADLVAALASSGARARLGTASGSDFRWGVRRVPVILAIQGATDTAEYTAWTRSPDHAAALPDGRKPLLVLGHDDAVISHAEVAKLRGSTGADVLAWVDRGRGPKWMLHRADGSRPRPVEPPTEVTRTPRPELFGGTGDSVETIEEAAESASFAGAGDAFVWERGVGEGDVGGVLGLSPVDWGKFAESEGWSDVEVAWLQLAAAECVSPLLFAPVFVGVKPPERVAFDLVVDEVAVTLHRATRDGLSEQAAGEAARARAEELAARVREAGLEGAPDVRRTARPPVRGAEGGVSSSVGGVGQRGLMGGGSSGWGSGEVYPGESQAGPSTVQPAAHPASGGDGVVASGQQDADTGEGKRARRRGVPRGSWVGGLCGLKTREEPRRLRKE